MPITIKLTTSGGGASGETPVSLAKASDKYDSHLTPKKPTTLQASAAKATLTSAHKEAGQPWKDEKHAQKVVHPSLMHPPHPAIVTVKGGQTLKVGDFEFVRMDVELSMPCEASDIESMYEFTSDWVSTKLAEAVKGIKE